MALTNICAIYCYATADILMKLLQQCFLFFIVVIILGHNLGNSQVSVYRTIGPTLVSLLRSSSDDRILWIRSGIEIMWLIEHVANGGQLLT